MDSATAREQALDAAEKLFYGRGVQSVGMDDVRGASGVSLKRLYQLFPAKEQLVEAYLERRDVRWRAALAESVARHADPVERILAVFDWLERWFGEPDFRGCAWINAYGELGATSERIASRVRSHKRAFRDYMGALVADADLPEALAGSLSLLAEGAIVTAGISGGAAPAVQAREAARQLLDAERPGPDVSRRPPRTA
ncbi:TetR/AcrR family transcriptional regulator [Streptomyces asoensis]|uniref:TetR family transcriptional regulator n=1 Tax=Streptomyces asoensis TaxID=249586 RepID=A0ABQ3S6R1_9ACTN|nr:TetR/AcrR family transcriptional regulator [Streptomyces asoensis]GGQ77906.1 TetR family transcriptional regulator [Streptomyces asoensis]GHI63820.1 TetR family transcriptional regulator [Streptomyces asoensis]